MKVLTLGTFDIVHAGHINLLHECQVYGEVYVGLNTDDFVEQYKGKRPLFNYLERHQLLKPHCDTILPNDSAGRELIDIVRPDLLVIGSDWLKKDYLKQIDVTPGWLEARQIKLLYTTYTPVISSSEIARRCRES